MPWLEMSGQLRIAEMGDGIRKAFWIELDITGPTEVVVLILFFKEENTIEHPKKLGVKQETCR